MGFNFMFFGLTFAFFYSAIFFLAWCAYDSDKFSPCSILLASMCMTAFVTTCLVYIIMTVYGG